MRCRRRQHQRATGGDGDGQRRRRWRGERRRQWRRLWPAGRGHRRQWWRPAGYGLRRQRWRLRVAGPLLPPAGRTFKWVCETTEAGAEWPSVATRGGNPSTRATPAPARHAVRRRAGSPAALLIGLSKPPWRAAGQRGCTPRLARSKDCAGSRVARQTRPQATSAPLRPPTGWRWQTLVLPQLHHHRAAAAPKWLPNARTPRGVVGRQTWATNPWSR